MKRREILKSTGAAGAALVAASALSTVTAVPLGRQKELAAAMQPGLWPLVKHM